MKVSLYSPQKVSEFQAEYTIDLSFLRQGPRVQIQGKSPTVATVSTDVGIRLNIITSTFLLGNSAIRFRAVII